MPLDLLASRIGRPFVCGHRGFSAAAPENTIAAFEAALQAGAEVIETDVRLTHDGHVVVIHDQSVDRTTNGSGHVRDLSLAQVKALDAGAWFAPRFAGERVPTLSEILEWCAGRVVFLVEIKDVPHREMTLVYRTIRIVEDHGAEQYVSLGGFDHVALAEIHRARPSWALHMNVHARLADPVHEARAAGASLICLEPEFFLAPDVEALHAAGVAVHAPLYHADHTADLLSRGVDVLEADDVTLVTRALRLVPPR
jgi:glycerophosphoryl diester phosphodiesterase